MLPEWPQGIVFDLDGTLADSRIDFAAIRSEIGCPTGCGILEFMERLDSEQERHQALTVVHSYEMTSAEAACWMDGAESLCHRLAGSGVPLGVFTRNSREAAQRMVSALGIPCAALIAREDAAAKPDPEGLLKIARRFRLRCEDMLCVGDFLYDLQAAANAGMPACLYDPEGVSPHRAMAEYVVRDFDELADLLYGDTRESS